MRLTHLAIGVLLTGLVVLNSVIGLHSSGAASAVLPGRTPVTGSVVASVEGLGPNGTPREIALPDISVVLWSVAGAPAQAVTDLNGRFVFEAQAPGYYRLCLRARGYAPDCRPDPVVLRADAVYLPPIILRSEPGVITGRVMRADQTPCRFKDTFFDVDVQSIVELVGGGVVPRRVRANNLGEYLVPRVPPGRYTLRATCEGAQTDQRVKTGPMTVIDLLVTNASPVVRSLVATVNGEGVRRVEPGTTVEVTVAADDPDGDALQYRWSPAYPEPGVFQSVDSPSVLWTLPAAPGLHAIYVLAGDRRGGYALGKLELSTDPKGALFSGRVYDPAAGPRVPLAGARVGVNGTATLTNQEGYFLVEVPAESPRYVLTIARDGYALLSRVFHEEVLGGHYELARSRTRRIDPTRLVDVTEPRVGHAGARLVIPPGSLVDEHGHIAAGPLFLSLSTVDLRHPEGRLPGDWGALTAAGLEVTLASFGAVHIAVRDSGGRTYNLMPGSAAVVQIPAEAGTHPPVTPGHAPEAGPRVAASVHPGSPPLFTTLWRYDADSGRWLESGAATLDGHHYAATIDRLGVLTAAAPLLQATPLRLLVNKLNVGLPVDLRVTIPVPGAPRRVFSKRITDPITILPHLPPFSTVTLEYLDGARTPIPGSAIRVGTLDPLPPAPPKPPGYPYLVPGLLGDVLVPAPHVPPPPAIGFLTYIENDKAVAEAYKNASDPEALGSSLSTWLRHHGFESAETSDEPANLCGRSPEDPNSFVTTRYVNAGDLGFGRAMHSCLMPSGTIGFWVINYPTVEDAIKDRKRQGTVGMLFERSPGAGPPFTKFFAFSPEGYRALAADLDQSGTPKFLPGLCMVCHGGDAGKLTPKALAAGHGNVGGRFIPFDLESFRYSAEVGFRQVDQEGHFKALNARVIGTRSSAASTTLILGWYGGVDLPSPTFRPTFVPFLWGAKPDLYSQVVKRACRSCHVTRDAPLDWATLEAFDKRGGSIQSAVCGSRMMPHAKVTWENFWGSTRPHQPDILAAAGLAGWDTSRPCPEP